MASIGSDYAPLVASAGTVAAIASARRAVLADRYPVNSFSVEWRWLADLVPVTRDWRDLAARALEPNVFYEPAFALAAGAFSAAMSVRRWSGRGAAAQTVRLFSGARGAPPLRSAAAAPQAWTHPYAPLGTPLVEREAAEPVISAWLTHLASDAALPGLLRLPLLVEDGHFATGARRGAAPPANAVCRFRPPQPAATRAGR